MNKQEAEKQGYTVDDYVYPWIAYKGPRFRPSEWFKIETPAYIPAENDKELNK